MRLTDLRELPLPPTTVAEGAWDRARRRRRRQTVVGLVAVVALVGTLAVGVDVVRGGHQDPPSPAPSPNPGPTGMRAPVVTDLPDYAALADAAPTMTPEDPTRLSADPVHRALLAVVPQYENAPPPWAVVNVLGDDGRWRYVDVPGLEPTRDRGGHTWYALVPTSLDATGTRLALPQPDRVIVVDLTTGEYQSYDVPGFNNAVVWQDASHLIVTGDGQQDGRVLDLADSSITASRFTANTGFAPDGSWVTWGRAGTLVSSDGTRVLADVANDGGLQLISPLVDDHVAVGLGGRSLTEGETTYVGMAGVAVVDRRSGDLRGFLYTEGPDSGRVTAYLLGLDGEAVTLAVGVPPDQAKLVVVRWSMRTGEVMPVATLTVGMVSGPLQ